MRKLGKLDDLGDFGDVLWWAWNRISILVGLVTFNPVLNSLDIQSTSYKAKLDNGFARLVTDSDWLDIVV